MQIFLHKTKRILAFLVILLLIVVLNMSSANARNGGFCAINLADEHKKLTSVYTLQNNFGGSTYHSVAFDFHIFADEVTLNAHTNGNIATNKLNAGGQAFGSTQKNYLNKQEDNYIGKKASGINNINSNGYIVLGSSVSTRLTTQKDQLEIGEKGNLLSKSVLKKTYQETDDSLHYIEVKSELSRLTALSNLWSLKNTSPDVTLQQTASGQQTISVSQSGGNHYLNVTAAEINNGGQKNTIQIQLPSKTTLIINVDMKNASLDSLQKVVTRLNAYTNGEAVISEYCGLLWNLYDSSNSNRLFVTNRYANVGESDYFFGTIFAPAAQIAYGAVNGSIIAQKALQCGKESHRFDFSGYENPCHDSTEATTESSSECTTEVPSSECTTEVPSSECTTEVPSSECTTEVPSSECTTEVPSSECTTEIASSECTTAVASSECTTAVASSECTTEIASSECTTAVASSECTTAAASSECTTEIASSECTTAVASSERTTAATSSEYTTEISSKCTTETSSKCTTKTSKSEKTENAVKTGDTARPLLIIMIAIIAITLFLGLCIFLLYDKKHKKDSHDEEL